MITELPGLDLISLRGHLRALGLIEAHEDIQAHAFTGGRSNLTYDVRCGSRHWVLRRPPLGIVYASAHDVAREFNLLTALHPAGVPVPRPLHLTEDPSVIGSPFFLMEHVDGTSYRWLGDLTQIGADRTRTISGRMIDQLATLHAVDPVEIGLGAMKREGSFVERQIRTWKRQLDATHVRVVPGLAELHRHLAAAAPTIGDSTSLVHGDFRLDNLLVDANDRVSAILDWELATVGDPLTDLALLLAYASLPAHNGVASDVSHAPGFLTRDELAERYALTSGRSLDQLGFYRALAFFKLAGITEGIHARYLSGDTVGDGFDRVGELVEPMVADGLAALKGL